MRHRIQRNSCEQLGLDRDFLQLVFSAETIKFSGHTVFNRSTLRLEIACLTESIASKKSLSILNVHVLVIKGGH